MELPFFLKGIAIGFAMSVPIGPIAVMCIRKTLAEGQLRGLVVGLGAATADFLYSCVAAFGLTFISNTLFSQRIWMRLVGGAFLFFLGLRILRTHPGKSKPSVYFSGIFKSYVTTFFLTLTNPLTIIAFMAVFAALSLSKGLSYFSTSTLVAGVFFGSCLWFVILSSGTILFKKRLDVIGLRWVNRIAGVFIMICGVVVIGSLF